MPKAKSEVAERNDAIRHALPRRNPADRILLTQGVQALGPVGVIEAIKKVAGFDEFTEDNDPWGDHDFGAFEVNGEKCFWKIDDYQGHDGIRCVLTILLADEY